MSSPTPPKGSLEDLFRHHLLDSEAAAVPPRPHVWEQLDNSLLLAQNEKYRRRLLLHRWAVAASLLLATLAGGGWWHSQQQAPIPLAQATRTGAGPEAMRHSRLAATLPAGNTSADSRLASAESLSIITTPSITSSPSNTLAIAQPATSSSSQKYAPAAIVEARARRRAFAAGSVSRANARLATAQRVVLGAKAAHGTDRSLAAGTLPRTQPGANPTRIYSAQLNSKAIVAGPATAPGATANPNEMAVATPMASFTLTTSMSSAATALTTRTAQLALGATAGIPSSLGAISLPEQPTPTMARRWQYGLAYAASTFQPNIDFAKAPSAYNTALGTRSVALTLDAAAEYRQNLRPGLGQRLSLWAMRRLGNGRFSLRTGLEIAQNTARSASSVAFTGEQVPDLSYTIITSPSNGVSNGGSYSSTTSSLRGTSFRYRSASVPVELHYSNPAKAGFSFYGRIGGLITALLNVRSEVEGNAEATRTYNLMSASSPYRHLSGSVRGGAGVQYRPTGHQWALSLGPIAEAGILSLNAEPLQGFWSQKRPYSFGLEAGVELGRTPHMLFPKAE